MAGGEQVFAATPIRAAGQRIIASPFEFFVTGEDNLRIIGVNSLSNVTLVIQGRVIDEKGLITPLRESLAVPATRAGVQKDVPLGPGAVLNLVVFVSGATPQIGQTFVMVQLIRGLGAAALVLGVLAADYVTSVQPIAWPGTGVKNSVEGGGYFRYIVGTTPGPGVECTETVPAGARWQLQSVQLTLTTDATAVFRQPFLQVDDASNRLVRVPSPANMGGSLARFFFFANGLPITGGTFANAIAQGLPAQTPMRPGHRFITTTDNLQPGDQYAAPAYCVQEWLEVT